VSLVAALFNMVKKCFALRIATVEYDFCMYFHLLDTSLQCRLCPYHFPKFEESKICFQIGSLIHFLFVHVPNPFLCLCCFYVHTSEHFSILFTLLIS